MAVLRRALQLEGPRRAGRAAPADTVRGVAHRFRPTRVEPGPQRRDLPDGARHAVRARRGPALPAADLVAVDRRGRATARDGAARDLLSNQPDRGRLPVLAIAGVAGRGEGARRRAPRAGLPSQAGPAAAGRAARCDLVQLLQLPGRLAGTPAGER